MGLAKSQAAEFKDVDSPLLQLQLQKSMESAASGGTPAVLAKAAHLKQSELLAKNQLLSSQDRGQELLHQT